jgi:hypothetical protein
MNKILLQKFFMASENSYKNRKTFYHKPAKEIFDKNKFS